MKDLLYLKDEQIKEFIEKLFLSYRDTFSDSKTANSEIYSMDLNIKIEVITFKKDLKDTRVKHVYLNEKGEKIFEEIFSKQKKRIYNALLNSSAKEVVDFNKVLKKLIKSNERV